MKLFKSNKIFFLWFMGLEITSSNSFQKLLIFYDRRDNSKKLKFTNL